MYNDNRLNELNQIISDVIYKENQKALDSGCDALCNATEYLADKIAEEVFKYHREEIDALRWTNKLLIKTEKEKRREIWKKAINQFLNYVGNHLVENGGNVGSHEIRFESLKKWYKEMEDKTI